VEKTSATEVLHVVRPLPKANLPCRLIHEARPEIAQASMILSTNKVSKTLEAWPDQASGEVGEIFASGKVAIEFRGQTWHSEPYLVCKPAPREDPAATCCS
jgi:hypothetical protein